MVIFIIAIMIIIPSYLLRPNHFQLSLINTFLVCFYFETPWPLSVAPEETLPSPADFQPEEASASSLHRNQDRGRQ